jgi:hypothetical protein
MVQYLLLQVGMTQHGKVKRIIRILILTGFSSISLFWKDMIS